MKNLILICIALILVQNLNAQSESCKVLLDKISGKYTGACKDGLANGKGTAIGEDTYIGSFKNGLPHGKGKYVVENGEVFKGFWKNGLKNGKGKLEKIKNGKKNVLTGYWKDDKYVGTTVPNIFYKVISASGFFKYTFKENDKSYENDDNEITFYFKNGFTNFIPRDLIIDNSSGHIFQSGRKVILRQYQSPLYCEISYSVVINELTKQCRIKFEILNDGKYVVSLFNE